MQKCSWATSVAVTVSSLAIVVATGCSSSSSTTPPGDGGTGKDSGGEKDAGHDSGPPANCVKPGTANNADGVGGYCDNGSGKNNCKSVDGASVFCTAAIPITPVGEYFCTKLCTKDTDCGGGGVICRHTSMGSACVPGACNIDAGF